MNFSLAI
jgi:hypothetical protein